jgi:hypothetical protein
MHTFEGSALQLDANNLGRKTTWLGSTRSKSSSKGSTRFARQAAPPPCAR